MDASSIFGGFMAIYFALHWWYIPTFLVLLGGVLSWYYYKWSYDPTGLFGDCTTIWESITILALFVFLAVGVVIGHLVL